MRRIEVPSYDATIYIAGDVATARQACRKFCLEGLCVSISVADFVYTNGAEAGVRVGLVNYPRFPATDAHILDAAERLATFLMTELVQSSALVTTANRTIWLTTRD